jgi:hypothetical protein
VNAIVWVQTGDRRTWSAAAGILVLTVSKTSDGKFAALVDGPGAADRAPGFRTRVLAQRWAEQRAGAR